MAIYTSRISYSGIDRLDITRKSGTEGLIFAPSWQILGPRIKARKQGVFLPWEDYVCDFTKEMRESYKNNKDRWKFYANVPMITLCCYCTDFNFCHRTLVANFLVKLGAEYKGER